MFLKYGVNRMVDVVYVIGNWEYNCWSMLALITIIYILDPIIAQPRPHTLLAQIFI